MSIKIQNTQDLDPFWDFDLLMENESFIPETIEEGQKQGECKKEPTLIQEGETKNPVVKGVPRGKGKEKKSCKKEKKDEIVNEPSQPEVASTSDATGAVSSEALLNDECYKYEILKKNFGRLQHSYFHLKKRFNNLNLHVNELKSLPKCRFLNEMEKKGFSSAGGGGGGGGGRGGGGGGDCEGEGAEEVEEDEVLKPNKKRKKTGGGGGGGGEDWAVVYVKL